MIDIAEARELCISEDLSTWEMNRLYRELYRHQATLPKALDEIARLQKLADERWSTCIHIEAELRRERDARADLRVELDRVRQERDEARRELVAAMRTIEEGARG